MATQKAKEARTPPQDVEAEISVLGSLMLDKDAIYRVADTLSPRDFYKPVHKDIYEAMLDLCTRREPVDVLSVTSRLKEKDKLEEIGGSAYLATLVNSVPTASHVEHYATTVKRKRLLRDLISASAHIAQLGYREADDVEELIDEAEQRIFGIAKDSLRQDFFPVKDILPEAAERIERLHKGDGALRGVSTGFTGLDNYLAGLQKSDLVILAARPSLGKTALALNIAKHVALREKKPVGVFSLEMSREQVADRLLASEAMVDLWRLRTGHLEEEKGDFTELAKAMGRLADAPLFIDDSAAPTPLEIRAKARRLHARQELGLIVIDYLQLIRGHGRVESRVQEVSEISRSLKALAKELNVPVLALSQLSRAIEQRGGNKKPQLSDLRESGCLAGDTLIMRADTGARVPIKKLVGQKNIPVFSLNGLRLETRCISNIFSSGHKQIFEMRLKSGRTIKASANHAFMTIRGWKRLDALAPGARLALPRRLTAESGHPQMPDDELALLAHLIGDGCVLPRQPIHYTSADAENIKIVGDAATRLFGISPRTIRQENWWHLYLPSPYRLARGRYHPITTWFKRLGIARVRSYEKELPNGLFLCSTDKMTFFLHHLWATDGNISWKRQPGRKPAAAIYYATTSKKLAEQVQHLLLRLGILAVMRTVPQKKERKMYRPSYHVAIEGSGQQLRFCEHIGSAGARGAIVPSLIAALHNIVPNPNNDAIPKEVWRAWVEPAKVAAGIGWRGLSSRIDTAYCGSTLFKHGLSRERMTRVAVALQSPMLASLAASDVYWDEVASIVPLGVEEVYDATVPETHNFVANDIIVHNSIEQDADVVMFIYRKDAEQKNAAEILIEKHRNGPTGKVELTFHEGSATFETPRSDYEEIL